MYKTALKKMIKMKLFSLLREGLSLLSLMRIPPCIRFLLFADVLLRQVDKYSNTELNLSFKIISLSFKIMDCALRLVSYDPP